MMLACVGVIGKEYGELLRDYGKDFIRQSQGYVRHVGF